MDMFINTSICFIPNTGTQPRLLLEALWDGCNHTTEELHIILGSCPRSALQALKRDWGFWLIHNIGDLKGNYQLDERHLCGIPELDMQARLEAELRYNRKSLNQSEREAYRQPSARLKLNITLEKFTTDIQLELTLDEE